MTSGSLWNYCRDEINDSATEINSDDNKINGDKTITSKSFEYKTKILANTPNDNNTLNAESIVPLKYLSNFWKRLGLSLINCEIEFDLSLPKECIISEILITPEVRQENLVNAIKTTGAFQLEHSK